MLDGKEDRTVWIFSRIGFFSAVRESSQPDARISVRARIKGDLEALRETYLPELTSTVEWPGRDYPYRGFCSVEELAKGMSAIAMDIDYNNFKSQVMAEQGLPRELLYARVWGVMNGADQKLAEITKAEEDRKTRWNSDGLLGFEVPPLKYSTIPQSPGASETGEIRHLTVDEVLESRPARRSRLEQVVTALERVKSAPAKAKPVKARSDMFFSNGQPISLLGDDELEEVVFGKKPKRKPRAR
jgi:hypothetical protein